MDKNAIKKYAVWARRELLARVQQKALQYGISETETGKPDAEQVNGRLLTKREIEQRGELIRKIQRDGFRQAMEAAAYTWFNRFCALRYMEVNGVLPSHIRVFTDEEGKFKPQILTEAIHLELDGLDMAEVYRLKEANRTEELYKYLLITQCNALGAVLPGMFTRIEDYTELLFPDNLLREGSVAEQLVTAIPEADWTDQVQIIGWLYQYYNTEPKDRVFANLKKNIKIGKDDIPAATQLFTPDWIVRYMVENSLGRLWVEGHPDDELKANWKYYLEEAQQGPEVEAQLAEIRKEYAALEPKDIKVIDPCMGSGHILVYLFDVLMQIYLSRGYNARDAVRSILENNLFGLDIDERAAQLAYFAVMMRAVHYDPRFLRRDNPPQPHVYAIWESNGLKGATLEYYIDGNDERRAELQKLLDVLRDAKEYGSILDVPAVDFPALYARFDEIFDELTFSRDDAFATLLPLIRTAEVMASKYHVVVTNPPYMGAQGMSDKLAEFAKSCYPETKSDLSTICMEKCLAMCESKGLMAMINIPVWMFLSTYEPMRKTILQKHTYVNMVHPGRGIFGSDFGTVTFVIAKNYVEKYTGLYHRLFTKQGEVDSVDEREQAFLNRKGKFVAQQENYAKILGTPVAYWVTSSLLHDFIIGERLDKVAQPKQGVKTADKDRFLRFWHEIDFTRTSIFPGGVDKWFPCNKGGSFRKWYGNNEYVVNWENNGYEICNYRDEKGRLKSRPQNLQYMLREGITYTNISISSFGARYSPKGFIYDAAGSGIFCENEKMIPYVLGFLTSSVAAAITKITSPTMSFEVGQISSLPFIYKPSDEIDGIVKQTIDISKEDWDSFEVSWDFKEHPFITSARWAARGGEAITIKQAFDDWKGVSDGRFRKLKENEEELNRLFIEIYGLDEELTPEVEDKDVTVRRADFKRDIRSLISYAVGCMFGRYSIYETGLVFAGGEWDYDHYEAVAKQEKAAEEPLDLYTAETFLPDRDNIIPITDDEYFADDIVARFVKFIETVYGKYTLEENLNYIASALGGSGSAREVIRSYFLNDFYKDHLKIYQKRPIYWLFDSGKKNGFKALAYMHRYRPDTLARIRTDYVHELQGRYRTAIADLEQRAAGAATAERVKLTKQLTKLREQDTELRAYEEKIHHLADQMIAIDLDDGVKVNYAKFQDVLAEIK